MDPAALCHSSSSSVSCARIFSIADLMVLASADDGFRSNAIVNACAAFRTMLQVATTYVDGHVLLQASRHLGSAEQAVKTHAMSYCADSF
jgi:hypothetical protein